MNIKINYGTGVATLPTAALGSFDRATKTDIKVLFLLCAEPYLLMAEDRDACISRICERACVSVGQIEASLAFWRGAGVLDTEDGDGNGLSVAPPDEASKLAPVEAPAPAAQEFEETSNLKVTVTRAKTRLLDEIPNYKTDELEAFFTRQADTSKFLDECQAAWEGVFNQREMETVIALVDSWGFSWEYVVSLLAYVSKQYKERENQGKSINSAYRMGVNFHKEGILTLDALQQKFVELDHMAVFERRIRAMFGMGERNLTPKEKKYFSTWLYEYKYNIEIVELAYNITVDAKGAPNMNYLNGVLKHWYEDGLTSLESIIAKRESENSTVQSIKEGKLTPDNALTAVGSILGSEPKPIGTPVSTNISQDINIIRRLLNLGNRMLTEGEIAAFTRWRADYSFRYEIIYQAYQITLENRREYNLPYMDAILKKWQEQKLTTLEAIRAYEKGYKEDKQKKKSSAGPTARESSFETEDFFAAAVRRSFGEDFDPAILNQ